MTRSQARAALLQRLRVNGVAALNRAAEEAAKAPERQELRRFFAQVRAERAQRKTSADR